nr:putative lrr receptor-like serine/threonine-protein kinase [Quercus suber]
MLCAIFVHGQLQQGFISIDCGNSRNFTYLDDVTGISYAPDEAYIDNGINKNISPEYAYPNNLNLYSLPLSDLRSFPLGNKNCYTLKSTAGKGNLYLIRGSFLYGNYDGLNKLPEFDIYFDVNFWSSLKFSESSKPVITEIIGIAQSDNIHVCLVNKGLGTPFISALELRPLNKSIYDTEFGTSASLVLFQILDHFNNDNDNGYQAPQEVIRTAARPADDSEPLRYYWKSDDPNSQFYVYLYVAEVEKLEKNQSRKFNISWNDPPLSTPFSPRYLYATTISSPRALISKHWVGDPCGPKNYSWEGLTCQYNRSVPPRIISMNLTSYGLTGTIAASLANLSLLESLDLSYNSLTGPVPEFLVELKYLKFLNLKNNQLSGSVPTALIERSEAGLLTLSVYDQVDDRNVCSSSSCKTRKKNYVPILAPTMSALVLFIALLVIWKMRRRRKSAKELVVCSKKNIIVSKKRKFTFAEVLKITNNFHTIIGKGGFGIVYQGQKADGTHVAVKMLSASSSQGPKEFQTEAKLLMTVYHRNLVSFVGYCDDGDNMALISEYMANGNLKDYLSDTSSHTLSWKMRLHIAIDAAQGLEYLHHGCNLQATYNTQRCKVSQHPFKYYNSRKLNEKSDVFSFGIVLLELITGQLAIVKNGEPIHLVHWVSPKLEMGDIESVVDKRLQGDFDVTSVWKALELALTCTTPASRQRATMSLVLPDLKECLAMELSRSQEKNKGLREEISSLSNNSSEMIGPFAR